MAQVKRKFTTFPVKYEDEVMGVSDSVAARLGLVKWQHIGDLLFIEIFDMERELWLIEVWKRGCGEFAVRNVE